MTIRKGWLQHFKFLFNKISQRQRKGQRWNLTIKIIFDKNHVYGLAYCILVMLTESWTAKMLNNPDTTNQQKSHHKIFT